MYNFSENNFIAKYPTLEAFTNATGQEKHGLIVDYDIFVDAKPPLFSEFNKKNKHLGNAYPVYYPEDVNLQLKKNSSVIDAGIVLPGINDNYNGKAPDLGAYEYGKAKPHYGPRINYLSEEEKEQGWILLFDGESHKGWRGFNMDSISNNWQVQNEALVADGSGGDIITEKQFEDFELYLEYKISKGGNSGVFYHVKEGEEYDKVWRTGVEMQVMDNANNPMGEDPVKNASSLYAMYPAKKDATLPAGQWNSARLIVKNGNVQYWLNGQLVNEYQLWTDQWYADREQCLHNASRKPDWGEFKKGHIALQDEGFRVAYRNIKIRELE